MEATAEQTVPHVTYDRYRIQLEEGRGRTGRLVADIYEGYEHVGRIYDHELAKRIVARLNGERT